MASENLEQISFIGLIYHIIYHHIAHKKTNVRQVTINDNFPGKVVDVYLTCYIQSPGCGAVR